MKEFVRFVSIMPDKDGKHSTISLQKDKLMHYAKCEWLKEYVEVDVEEQKQPVIVPVRIEPDNIIEPMHEHTIDEDEPFVQVEEKKKRGRKAKTN